MSVPAQYNGEAIAVGFFGKIFRGYCGMSLQPFFGCPVPQVLGDLVVNGCPGVPEVVGGVRRSSGIVGVGDEYFVEVGILSVAHGEEGQHAVMQGCQVAEQVNDAVFSRGNGLKEFFVGQIAEEAAGLPEGLFPTEEDGFYK